MTTPIDPIHLGFGFDERMELPFLILAHSISRRLQSRRKVIFHILHTQPLRYCETYLGRFSSELCEFRYHEVNNPLSEMRMRNGISAAKYLRFLLPELLADIERIVWIDCDTIVLKDVSELYDMSLDGFALAAVLDYSIVGVHPLNGWPIGEDTNRWPVDKYCTEVLELSDWTAYFNSGILVMDLAQFRQRDLIKTCRELLVRTEKVRIFNDQDCLNHAIDGAFKRLDPRWNVQASRQPQDFANAQGSLASAAKLWQSDPWILHYAGPGKPWSGATAGTVWDRHYWREAALSPMLPELIDVYLASCARETLTNLFSPRDLLALGKPRLDDDAILACADRFADLPPVSSAIAGLVRSRDAWPGPTPLVIPSARFKQTSGVPQGDTVVFDLAGANRHLVYGPYACYPP